MTVPQRIYIPAHVRVAILLLLLLLSTLADISLYNLYELKKNVASY